MADHSTAPTDTEQDDTSSPAIRHGPLRVLDLFAGCGGLSLGFQKAGYRIVGGIERDALAASTFASNFFHDDGRVQSHGRPRDVVSGSDLAEDGLGAGHAGPERFMSDVLKVADPRDAVDVIVGGPPCQAFSRVGRAKLREILNHPRAFLRDERAGLYHHFLGYVTFFRPLAVVMENVPEMMNFGGQNVAEAIAASLEEIGYVARYTSLNSAHYGVPQLRQRLFLMALRSDLGVEPRFPEPTYFIELPDGYRNGHGIPSNGAMFAQRYIDAPTPCSGLPKAVTVKEALGDLPPIMPEQVRAMGPGRRRFDTLAPYVESVDYSRYVRLIRQWPGFESTEGVWDHVTRCLPRDVAIFQRMKPGDEYPEAHDIAVALFEHRLAEAEREQGHVLAEGCAEYRRLKKQIVPPYDPGKFPNKWWKLVPGRPSRTLTAHMGRDTYSHIHYDDEQARVISVREAARLQSFPDGFRFAGAMGPAFRQIGNSVPPLQAYAIACALSQLLSASTSGAVAKGEARNGRTAAGVAGNAQ